MKFKDLYNEDWTVDWESIGKLSWFERLLHTTQSERWHREGNALNHTKMVSDKMCEILNEHSVECGSDEWIMCMSAAICHDLGKADTTKWSEEKKDWVTKNHGVVGERITRNLFYDEDIVLREKVCYMVRHHMTLHHILDNKEKTDQRFIKLSHGIVPIKYMIWLNTADSLGSINEETGEYIIVKADSMKLHSLLLSCYEKSYAGLDKTSLLREFVGYEGETSKEEDNFTVYILCGFPGSGKSTYIKEKLNDKKVISRDVIRQQLGIGGSSLENDKKVVGTKEEEDKVSELFDKQMEECCKNGEDFVLDNTNLKYQYRKEYLLKVLKYDCKVKIIYIEAPDKKTCRKRREGEITRKVYDRMEENFDFPQLYECHELIIYKQHEGKEDETYTFE